MAQKAKSKDEWAASLEAFIRAIVREEMGRTTPADTDVARTGFKTETVEKPDK